VEAAVLVLPRKPDRRPTRFDIASVVAKLRTPQSQQIPAFTKTGESHIVIPNERILVIPSQVIVPKLKSAHSLDTTISYEELTALIRRHHQLVDRAPAETDHSLKQIIPYAIIRFGDQVYLVKRSKRQAEARLHDLYSIGLGGHISELVDESSDVIRAALVRELEEEMVIAGPSRVKYVGIINDDTTDVGKVHLGILHEVLLEGDYCRIREKENMTGNWCAVPSLVNYYDTMETWSQIVCKYHLLTGSQV
jgi:predicted NUDIX family phosphoesterase